MACFTVAVSITYKLKVGFGDQTEHTSHHTSPCLASPFSMVFDRPNDGVFLNYNGGRWLAEGGWANYDLLSMTIDSTTPCTGCTIPNAVAHDCINGACIPASKYSTPGFYETIEDCEINCGTIGCNGICIGRSDWAQIQGLASQLRSKECG